MTCPGDDQHVVGLTLPCPKSPLFDCHTLPRKRAPQHRCQKHPGDGSQRGCSAGRWPGHDRECPRSFPCAWVGHLLGDREGWEACSGWQLWAGACPVMTQLGRRPGRNLRALLGLIPRGEAPAAAPTLSPSIFPAQHRRYRPPWRRRPSVELPGGRAGWGQPRWPSAPRRVVGILQCSWNGLWNPTSCPEHPRDGAGRSPGGKIGGVEVGGQPTRSLGWLTWSQGSGRVPWRWACLSPALKGKCERWGFLPR